MRLLESWAQPVQRNTPVQVYQSPKLLQQWAGIQGTTLFPMTSVSPKNLYIYCLQAKLNEKWLFKLAVDGKLGPATFNAIDVLQKTSSGPYKDIYTVAGQISRSGYDKVMSFNRENWYNPPQPFTPGYVEKVVENYTNTCYHLALILSYLSQNSPKKGSKLGSSDTARIRDDIQELLDKHNKGVVDYNTFWEAKTTLGFGSKKYASDVDDKIKAYTAEHTSILQIPAAGAAHNDLKTGNFTLATHWSQSAERAKYARWALDFIELNYNWSPVASDVVAPKTESNGGGFPGTKTPGALDNTNPLDQLTQILNVGMQLVPFVAIFLGIKFIVNVTKGFDKNTKF